MSEELVNSQFRGLEPSSTLQINEISHKLINEGKEVFKFGLGQSPFPIPEIIVNSLKKNAFQKDYLNVSGLFELREAVSQYHTLKNNYQYKPDNILIGPGSKELLFQCQMVIKSALILPSPSWVSYEPQARFLNKKVYWLETSKNSNWHLTAKELERHCSTNKKESKLLILNSPNNPSGTNNEELEKIAVVCKKNNIIVISDEIYSELDFNGKYESITHFYPEGTIITSGLSKWCGAGGWRLGTLIFPEKLSYLCSKIRSLASETFTSVSAPIQYAAVKAYTENHDNFLENSRKVLNIVANYVFEELKSVNIECIKPQGGFYMLCDFTNVISRNNVINSANKLCNKILCETGFAMLPGSNFGIDDEKLITRIAFVDFDGKKALEHISKEKINQRDMYNLFPKIVDGINALKTWIEKNSG